MLSPLRECVNWAFSSAGSEHLPYKQRVGGSNPSTPTLKSSSYDKVTAFFFCVHAICMQRWERFGNCCRVGFSCISVWINNAVFPKYRLFGDHVNPHVSKWFVMCWHFSSKFFVHICLYNLSLFVPQIFL